MPKAVDLTNKYFGEWLVLGRANNKGKEVMWHCHCSCGNEKDVNAKSLKNGKSLSCGCKKLNMENLVGNKYGKLVVSSQENNICHCKCDCGNNVDYTVRELVNGRHKSCGCLLHQDEDLVGKRFGKLVAKKKMYKNNDIGYLCKCDCGNEKFFLAYQLRNNFVKSCGCARYDFSGEDLTNKKFGEWTVKSFSHIQNGISYWNCVCNCGTKRKVSSKSLKKGLSLSCGCLKQGTHKHLEGLKIGKWTILENIDSLRWLCRCECGTERIVHYSNIIRGLSLSCGCQDISHKGSSIENEIKQYIENISNKKFNKVRILDGLEIDMYNDDLKLGIEYNGSIYHASVNGLYDNKDKYYHRDKFLLAKEKGIHLINIFDVDWKKNKKKLKMYLSFLLTRKKKIYARNCNIVKLPKDIANDFVDKYHLQGSNKKAMKINYGLVYKNELISVMSFGVPKYKINNNLDYELHRYCTKDNYMVVGGAEKMFYQFLIEFNPQTILSYSDNDYFLGTIYDKLGFIFDGHTNPSYYWFYKNTLLKREQCQPKKLKELYVDLYNEASGSKEDYVMTKLGARKVYRSGNTRWIYRKEE